MKERPTGNISVGAGYSTSEGIVLSGGFSQNNVFGTGNSLSLEVNTSKSSRTYAASFTQPYITTSGISQSFEIYDRKLDLDELEITDDVKYETYGAGVTYGVPITENDQIFLGGKFEMTDVTVGSGAQTVTKTMFTITVRNRRALQRRSVGLVILETTYWLRLAAVTRDCSVKSPAGA